MKAMQNLDPIESTAAKKMAIGAIVLGALAWAIVALLCGCAHQGSLPPEAASGIPNLTLVDEPAIYCGGQPKSASDWRWLRNSGVSNVVKLNTQQEASDAGAIAAGMTLYYFPIDTMEQLVTGPDPDKMAAALSHVGPGTIVHCQNGNDRSRTLIYMLRMQEGWSRASAYEELSTNGFHKALFGLEEFVEHYQPK